MIDLSTCVWECRDYITKLYIISRVCLCDVIVHVALALLFVLMAFMVLPSFLMIRD